MGGNLYKNGYKPDLDLIIKENNIGSAENKTKRQTDILLHSQGRPRGGGGGIRSHNPNPKTNYKVSYRVATHICKYMSNAFVNVIFN